MTDVHWTDRDSLSFRIVSALTPLHYATFGGLWLKGLYTLLGLGLCVMIVTGLMIWVERRAHGQAGRHSEGAYHLLSRVNLGVSTGLCFASIFIFYPDKLMAYSAEERLFWTGAVFFGAWAFIALLALLIKNEYLSLRIIFGATAALFVGIPVLNYFTTSTGFFEAYHQGLSYVYGFDITALIIGLCLISVIYSLPKRQRIEGAR